MNPRNSIRRKRRANKRMEAYNDTPIVRIKRAANLIARKVRAWSERREAIARHEDHKYATAGHRVPEGEWEPAFPLRRVKE